MGDIYIERREKILRVAIKENNILKECYIDEEKEEPSLGEIYKGIVKKIVPGLKGAFIDIGYKKQAYMIMDSKHKDLKCGDELILEVIKESFGSKGVTVTPSFSLPGRYVVLEQGESYLNISKKIEDDNFKLFLKENINTYGKKITIRTKSQLVALEDIQKEIDDLYNIYEDILRQGKYSLKPKKLYGDEDFISKLIRDKISDNIKNIFVDSKEDYTRLKKFIDDNNIEDIDITLFEDGRSLFDFYGIEKDILSLRNNKVVLKCGGSIIIEKTEAMHVVDVNSGKNINGKNIEKTAKETNLEAAKEIAKQIKLRNLGGIILVDFIDMHKDENKKEVISALKKEFRDDKNKTKIFNFTELNLVQISRARFGKSIYEYIEEECITCNGHGKRLKLSYIYLLIRNEILKKNGLGKIKDFHVEINKIYEKDIKGNIFEFLKEIDSLNLNIYLEFKETYDFYKVEALIFKNQIDNVKEYLIKNIEKC
ncbi:MAG: Rne/Rng family ribonuclease [Clostridium perfringens]|nr:Rne/Rng family ribonuclease [Clostridium perfringens]